MLVPRSDVAPALALGAAAYRKRNDREMEKLGVKARELDRLAERVLAALAEGPMEPARLREMLPARAIRSLGDAGKKLGHATTLPVALRMLEARGAVRRSPVGGTLDAERYEWGTDDSGAAIGVTDAPGLASSAARRYFEMSGPATRKDLATWSGATQRDAAAAMELLGLEPVEVQGLADDYWALPEHLAQVRKPPEAPQVVLVPFRDPLLDGRATVRPLVRDEHAEVQVENWGAGSKRLGEVKSLHHRVIVLSGAIGGLWDYDPDEERVIWTTFDPVKGKIRKEVERQCAEVGTFLRDSFGHARVYPMESAKSRAGRLAVIRGLNG